VSKTLVFVLAALIIAAVGASGRGFVAPYPYCGRTFRTLVEDSYTEGRRGSPEKFYRWFEAAFAKSAPEYEAVKERDLPRFLDAEKRRIDSIKNPKARATEEVSLGAYLHKVIKKTIPFFSLDRGFEFHAVQRLGERQCLLQGVLIAALLQQMGVNAGIAMVYCNERGETCFNGHVTTLVKLSDGRDIMVDASEPEPFARHHGILARAAGYSCLSPVYDKGTSRIIAYRTSRGTRVKPDRVAALDADYVRSQFYYYRGERAPGGVIASKRSKAGLAASARLLRKSVKLSPANSLAVYMLGKTYAAQGKSGQARAEYQEALKLQQSYGWVPEGISEALSGGA